MNRRAKIIPVLGFFLVTLIITTSCGGAVSQEAYDNAIQKLSEAENQLSELENQVAEAGVVKLQYEEINTKYEEVNTKYEALKKQYDEMEDLKTQQAELMAQYEELKEQNDNTNSEMAVLQSQYDLLQVQYEAATQPPEEITAEKVEQVLFDLINEERRSFGVPELGVGKNLYTYAKQHSKNMAETGRFEYSDWVIMQEIYWAVGYSTVEQVANATLMVWKSNQYNYEHGILSIAIKYCTIGAYKSGEIVYITFMGADFQ